MSKIIQLNSENVKVLKAIEITPKGNVIELTGKNGQGKSSVIDSIIYALSGKKSIPAEAVRKGEDSAEIRVELENIIITRKIKTDGSSTLKVESKEGAEYKSPQALLDSLTSSISFDPLEFAGLNPKQQFEMLRSVVQCDFNFEENESQYRNLYNTRSLTSRDLQRLADEYDAIKIAQDTPTSEINVSDLSNKLYEAITHNASIESLHNEKTRLIDEKTSLLDKLKSIDSRLVELDSIAPKVDIEQLREQVSSAEAVNEQVRLAKRKAELKSKLDELYELREKQTIELDSLKTVKANAIMAIKMPVEGLTFGDDSLLFNNIPLAQCSQGEKIKISTTIAMNMAKEKQLRVVLIKDASLLDADNMEMIRMMAVENDFQVWLERVDSSDKVGIVIEAGEIKAINE